MAAQLQRLAELAVRVGACVQPGQDVVVLTFDVEQAPIARAVAEVAYADGARFVSVVYWDQHVKRSRLMHAPAETLDFLPDWWERLVAECVERRSAVITAWGDPHRELLDVIALQSPPVPERMAVSMAQRRQAIRAKMAVVVVSPDVVLALLLFEQRRGDLAPHLASADPLEVGAAALAAGEPKRALRVFAGLGGPLIEALAVAAQNLDLNRQPGGAGSPLTDEESAVLGLLRKPPLPPEPEWRLAAIVAAQLIPLVQSARRIAEDARSTPDSAAGITALRSWFAQAAEQINAPKVSAYVQLAFADVLWRAGQHDEAQGMLAATAQAAQVNGDPVGLAHLAVVAGDWALEPEAPVETLGLQMGSPRPSALQPNPIAADQHYDDAASLYAGASAIRGLAAVALRRAHIARRAGDAARRKAELDKARALAQQSGERELERLLDVHELIDRLADDEDVEADALDPLAEWARTDGGTGFARGVARMLAAQARAWSATGALLPGFRAVRVARALAARLEAASEADAADRTYIDLLDGVNFRRASAVLLAAEAAEAIAALRVAPAGDVLAWLRAAELAMSLDNAVEATADPDLKGVSAAQLAEVARAAPATTPTVPWHQAAEAVRASAERAETLRLRYLGRRAEAAGHAEEAARLNAQALARVPSGSDELLRAVLLADAGRTQEAFPLVHGMWQRGELHADHAADLFLVLGDPAAAQTALAALDASDWRPSPDKPWTEPARRAEVARRLGKADKALALTTEAIDVFERRQAELVRDPLRSAAADDVTVAAMFHTGVLAQLSRDAPKAAFQLSDRGRAVIAALRDSVGELPVGAARGAARRWLRAGSAWAATYEGLLKEVVRDPAKTPSPDALRARMLAAERELEAAESELATIAPAFLAGRRRRTPPHQLDDVRASLGKDELLLHYEAFDDELVVWAIGRTGVAVDRAATPTRELAATARRFLDTSAGRRKDDGEGERLGELLLAPAAEAIQSHPRLLVVPHRALALVPFHVLPFANGLLSDAHTLSSLPAAALAAGAEAAARPRFDAPALLVGDPAYAPDRRLPRLPGTATEVQTIAQLLGVADPLLQSDATEAEVLTHAAGRPVVHLATHGFVDDRAPNRSCLALAGADELTLGDVMGSELGADLVVLSACHTGRGSATAAGDVVGLVRAVLATGAKHLVVSLWPVDDESGCLTMAWMYTALTNGQAVAAALAEAQRRVRALDAAGRAAAYEQLRMNAGTHTAAPHARDVEPEDGAFGTAPAGVYYWAPFIHVGR